MPVLREWDLSYGIDDVLRCQSADPDILRARVIGDKLPREKESRPLENSSRALEVGRSLIEPVVLMERLTITSSLHNCISLEDGSHLTGSLITEHLLGADEVALMLCTIGGRLEERVSADNGESLSSTFALDAVGTAATNALSAAACNKVEHDAVAAGLQTGMPLSPGMEGWSVEQGQNEIFSIIDPAVIGVSVSEIYEMKPLKSLTVVIGIGEEMKERGVICDYCTLRDSCRQRVG